MTYRCAVFSAQSRIKESWKRIYAFTRLPGRQIFLPLEEGFAKGPGHGADLSIPDPMKSLVSQMGDLKLRLLDTIVQKQGVDTLSRQKSEPDKMMVCKAVEDRLCQRIDLASRADLTDQQAIAALRLLLKIARKNDLAVEFSTAEISLLRRSISQDSYDGENRLVRTLNGGFSGGPGGFVSATLGCTPRAQRTSP